MGKTNRATAITDMNEHSSRSHALLCVTVIGVNRTTGHRTTGNNQFDWLKSPFATYSVICVVLLLAKRCARAGQTGENLNECRYAREKALCFNLTSFRHVTEKRISRDISVLAFLLKSALYWVFLSFLSFTLSFLSLI